jgi:D-alanyl-D-alanine carboxypeptidase/D-alanyl-D-alanine-endopeptidase (penicillin-binding protein 4)
LHINFSERFAAYRKTLWGVIFAALFFSVAPLAFAQQGGAARSALEAEIRRELDKMGDAGGVWGVHVIEADSGNVVADIRGDLLLLPASNRKLFTTALALRRLGPEYEFTSRVWAVGDINGETLRGDLVLEAGGDPTLRPTFQRGRSGLGLFGDWARKVRESGIARITGDLVIDCSFYEEPTLVPPGWGWDQFVELYGALPSVLAINENRGIVTIRPGNAIGAPCVVETQPGHGVGFSLANQCQTVAESARKRVRVGRSMGPAALTILGEFPMGMAQETLTVPLPDPAAAWSASFRESLERAGVFVGGQLRLSPRREAPAQESGQAKCLVVHTSPPLAQVVSRTNKDSDNHCAEMLFLAAGSGVLGVGSYASAQAAEKQFLREIGIAGSLVQGEDGSGLARTNLIATRAIARLLMAMTQGRGADEFFQSLPVSGADGTLRNRMSDQNLGGRVRAKTGTLRDVCALSGYLDRPDGRRLVFSFVANHYSVSTASIRAAQERLCALIAQSR